MTPTPITDELRRVTMDEPHASSPGQHPGGEWDAWYALPRLQRRRLIGSGWATAWGNQPDVLAHIIEQRGVFGDQYEALAWFYRNALLSIDELRAARNRDRHNRIARESGHDSYYDRRVALVRATGHASLWHYRKTKGWG